MRLLIQRVKESQVQVQSETVAAIAQGLLVLVGFHKNDVQVDLQTVAKKLVGMRIFSNSEDRFDKSVADVSGGILLVPQFTLFADTRKGRRPDFFAALQPALAKQKFHEFAQTVANIHPDVVCGIFGADMQVSLINDGPVTIVYDSPETSDV